MWRFLIPASMMVGALVVLFAGALGDLKSLPSLRTEFPAFVASAVPNRTEPPETDAARASPSPVVAASPAIPPQQAASAPIQQPATAVVQQQLTELQAQITQGTKQVAGLRTDAETARHQLETLQQQRQVEEAAVAQLQSQHQQLAAKSPTDANAGSPSAEASAVAAQQQAANDALQRQATELQAQIKQRSDELASLRSSTEQARHELDTSHQQRQAEEAAVARLQAQQRQLAATEPSNPLPVRQRPQQQTSQPVPAPPPNTAMQTTLAELRAKERIASPQPQQQLPTQPASAPAPSTPTQPVLIVSTRGVLVTARELLASGRAADARQLLMKAQAESTLHPVTPDQPLATGRSATAVQIGDAIRLLDAGNTGSALRAINLAMDNTNDGAGSWPSYSQTSGSYGASTRAQPYSGTVQR